MALVLWAVLFSVQAAYRLRDETVGAMALQGASEYLRHGEEIAAEEAVAYAERLAGRPFSWSGYKFIIEEKRTALMGRSVSASGKGGTWSLSIRQNEYDPENFLRMCSLLNQHSGDMSRVFKKDFDIFFRKRVTLIDLRRKIQRRTSVLVDI